VAIDVARPRRTVSHFGRKRMTHPESVRQCRIEEREDDFDAKRLRRVRARLEARAVQAAGP
jgi:hypothetical protein